MEDFDLLIKALIELKEELAKGTDQYGIHDSLESFMTGLRALPKGSAQRNLFIDQHLRSPGFQQIMARHPQGGQIRGQLINYLDSSKNAGLGQQRTIASAGGTGNLSYAGDARSKQLAAISQQNKVQPQTRTAVQSNIRSATPQSIINKPVLPASHPNTLPSVQERRSVLDTPGDKLELDTAGYKPPPTRPVAPQMAGSKVSFSMGNSGAGKGLDRISSLSRQVIKTEE